MSIKAVIFDFGGVLCFHPTEQQLSEAAELCGLTTPEFVEAFWKKRREYDRGHDAKAYWQDIASQANRVFDDAMVAEMVRREIDFWSNYDYRVLNWAGQLRDSGFGTSILSNLPRALGETLRATPGFLDPFQQITFSYELSSIKPERKIYDYAVEGLGIKPEEALFLDDRPENVEGAGAAGLQSVVFTTWEDFLANDRERFGLPAPKK